MNSLIRQHHIRLHDLRKFVHNYDPANAITSLEWARTTSAQLSPGTLIFLLEPVTPGFNLTARKEDDENFRVVELSIVTRLEDNKVMVISISNNAYELRFLESLLEEKARKAVIDRKKLYLVMASPIAPLTLDAMKELERLANSYAKGGSRRSFMLEDAHPNDEPAMAVLTVLGVHLQWIGSGKQPLDLGSLCYLLFGPAGRQEDSNRTQLQAHFLPIQNQLEEKPESLPQVSHAPNFSNDKVDFVQQSQSNEITVAAQGSDRTAFSVLDSWGETEQSENFIGASSVLQNLTNKFASETEQPSEQIDMQENKLEEGPIAVDNAVPVPDNQDVYQHLSDALVGLLGAPASEPSNEIEEIDPNRSFAWAAEPPVEEMAKPEEVEMQQFIEPIIEPINTALPQPFFELQETEPEVEPEVSAEIEQEIAQEIEQEIQQEIEPAPEPDIEFESQPELTTAELPLPTTSASVDISPIKLDDFQEPKLVINEMSSLMHKIESQVARAAKKLASKTAEIEKRISTNLDELLNQVIQEDKNVCAVLVVEADSLAKQFESSFDSLKAQLSEKSSTVRQEIETDLANHQGRIHELEESMRDFLIKEFDQNKTEFLSLIDNQESQLKKLIREEGQSLNNRLNIIYELLEKSAVRLNAGVSDSFNNFKRIFEKETQILPQALEQHMAALNTDIECAHDYGTARLKLIKSECIASLEHLVNTTEIALSRQIRAAHIEFFLPRLKERKQLIEIALQEMRQKFTEQSFGLVNSQREELDSSIVSARQQLKDLMENCLAKLESVGRAQQSGLEEIFRIAANSLEQDTDSVLQFLKRSEEEIAEDQKICKKLAETYSLDSDPALAATHQKATDKVNSLKVQLKNELESALDKSCSKLENLAEHHCERLNAQRTDLVQVVRLSSEDGLQRIRQAIQNAYVAVQTQREKYME